MDCPVVFSPIGSPNSIIFIIYWWTIDVDCDWIFYITQGVMYYIQPYVKLVNDTDVCVFLHSGIPIPSTNMIDRFFSHHAVGDKK
jgi:hypothetical protein